MMTICMMAANDLSHDPRVERAARAASRGGYRVVRLGHDPEGTADRPPRHGEGRILVPSWRYHIAKAFASVVLRPVFFLNPLWTIRRVARRWPRVVAGRWRDWVERRWARRVARAAGRRRAWNSRWLDQVNLVLSCADLTRVMGKAGRAVRADLYHAHDLPALPAALAAAEASGAGVVYDAHELWVEMNPEWCWWFRQWATRLEARHIVQADRCIAVNGSIGKTLSERYGVASPTTILNCPDRHQYSEERAHDDRKNLSLGPNDVAVLYQGRYEPGRGLEELIDAAPLLTAHMTVFLRGYGVWEERLRERVRKNGMEARVKFLPPVPMDDLVQAAAFADIGVLPYRPVCENNRLASPNKLFEYMMAGLAVAASDLPELRRLLGENGWFFDPNDPASIAQALNSAAGGRETLNRVKASCRESARTRYNWETEGRTLVAVYDVVTGCRRTQPACAKGEPGVLAGRG